MSTTTVFFDVDFTLIYPGPAFDGQGYRRFAARHGVQVDPRTFEAAVTTASGELARSQGDVYRPELFVRHARRVLEEMGGVGHGLGPCAQEIYDEWASCHHFSLYGDVRPVVQRLHARGLKIGLISNTHRCLATFQSHFALGRFIAVAVSSSEHGYMKPHPSIFETALERIGAAPTDAVMVGDSLSHDVIGAREVGMRGVWLTRSSAAPAPSHDDVPVIETLHELPEVLETLDREDKPGLD